MKVCLAIVLLAVGAAPALAQSGWPAPAGPGLQRLVIPPAAQAATPAMTSQRKSEIPPAPEKLALASAGAAGAAAAGLASGGLALGAPLGLLAVGAAAVAVTGGGSSATVTTR